MRSDLLRFGPYTLDASRLELRRGNERVRIQAKPLALLAYLVQHADRVVSHEEILREVWPGVHVDAGALKSAIFALRRALAEGDPDASTKGEGSWIASVHGQGYRFAQPLRREQVGPAPVPPALRTRPGDFVDREAEVERLRALLQATLRGERQIVLLGGAPGIGKTRMASELAREAAALGFEIHIGRAHEGDGAPPFWPWAQIVRSWVFAHGAERLESLAGPGSQASDLLGLAPELEPQSTAHPASAYRLADRARFCTLDRVSTFLERAARERPLLLILDDLHRADSASIELLVFAAQHVLQAPLAIVGTHRPLDSVHPIGRVLREPATCSIALTGMERSAVEGILEQICGRKASAALVERVHTASGGNPLFVYELARTLAADEAADAPLPARVHDAVWGRICECSPACLELLRLASAAGPELTLPILRGALADLGGAEILDALEEAERRDLLICVGGTYRFVHGIVREALYEKLGPTERMLVHRQIGEALEALLDSGPAPRLSELAHHFLECAALYDPDRALRYARRAAEAARAVCAFPEEVELRRGALRVLDFVEQPDPMLRVRVLVELGEALGQAAAPIAEFQSVFAQAMELARRRGWHPLLACAAERFASHMSKRGAFLPVLIPASDQPLQQTLIADLRNVLEAPEVQSDPVLHARVCVAFASTVVMDRPEESLRALERAFGLGVHSADPELRGEVLIHRCSFLYEDPAAREALQQELLAWALETQNVRMEHEARLLQMTSALERGDRAGCEAAAVQLERLGALGLPSAVYYAESWRFLRAQLEGPILAATDRSQRMAQTGVRLNLDAGWVTWVMGLQMAWLLLQAGMTELVRAQSAPYAPRVWHVPETRMGMAYLEAATGRHEEARRLLAELPRKSSGFGFSELWLCGMSSAAEACLLIRDPERALPIFEALAPYAGRMVSFVTLVLGPVSRYLGGLAALLGRWDEAEKYFDEAALQMQSLRAPVFAVLVDAERALALGAHPDPHERRRSDRLRASTETAARALGMNGIAGRLAAS